MSFKELFMLFNRAVTIEVPKITHETRTGILIEHNSMNAWLPKAKVTIEQLDDCVRVKLPRRLYKKKF